MHLSFEEFIKHYFPDSIKLQPYQLEIINNIQNNNKPFNFYNIHMKARDHTKAYEAKIDREWRLLYKKPTFDAYTALYYHFENDCLHYSRLVVDDYSQSFKKHGLGILDYIGDTNKFTRIFNKEVTWKYEEFMKLIEEMNEVIRKRTQNVEAT